jgi:hypothetical protein
MTVRNTTGTHSMRPAVQRKGFALLEMLFVCAILLALAFALACLIQSVDEVGPNASKMSKGRGIWLAIMSANMEREAAELGPLWPHDLRLPVDQGGGGYTFTTATEYFKILMTGDRPEKQLVPDFRPEMLSAGGYPPTSNATDLTANNVAWRVVEVSEGSHGGDAFMISKDLAPVTRSGASNEHVVLSRSGPCNGKYVVWVTRGGGVFDARKKYVTNWGMFFPSTNHVPFLPD